ncbi:hypothetical protein ACFYQA_08265 [Streptomyces sp. NPDC005774]|uniref:hypothetical protein n=1 Tax=Streptomyces sp. NPDC005774 TaxID=3364728 RepID=UPI0036C7CA81
MMGRLWTCGFELQSTSAEAGVNSGAIVTGTPSISTTVRRAGTASLRCNPTVATGFVEHQFTPGLVMRSMHRLYLRVDAYPSTNTNIYSIGQGGYFPALLRLQPDGRLVLRDGFVETTLAGTSPVLDLGRWYRIELDYTDVAGALTAGVAAFKGYLDGTLFADALCTNTNGVSRVRMGVQLAATTDLYIDDVAINDTAGSVQNGLPGPGNVVHLRPNAAGDANLWATAVGGTAGAANNWTRVAERTPDDATSYNQTAVTGTTAIDDFNVESPAAVGIGSGDAVTLVQVGGRVASNAATAASIVYRLKGQAGGTVAESASVSVANTAWSVHSGVSPRPYFLTAYTNPQTGAAWSPAALEGLQVGYRGNVSQTTVRRVSTLWALVEFVPATAQALGTASETGIAQSLGRTKTMALGTATETSAAQPVAAALPGTPISALVDAFDDGVVDPVRWPDSYEAGGFLEVGGRARVACNVGYNAFASDPAYRLRESSAHVRLWPPAAGGATDEAWAQLLIQTTTLGTDAIFEVSAVAGTLIMASRTAYWDPEQVTIPYDPIEHAWLRVREASGQLMWDTSPDGVTWTSRRTITSPVWVGDTTLQVQLIAHRDGGVDDFAEFDSFNVVPGGGTEADLVPATETGSAQALAGRKTLALGTAVETSAAQALTGRRTLLLGTAGETSAAQALGRARSRALTPAASTEAGHALAGTKRSALGAATATDTAQALGRAKQTALTGATAVETARSLGQAKQIVLGAAVQTEDARTLASGRTAALDPAGESAASQPLGRRKARALAGAAGTETAQPLTAAKRAALGTASEATAGQLLVGRKAEALGVAGETSAAQPLASASGLTPAEETSTALLLGRSKTTTQGVAGEVGEARPVGRAKRQTLGWAADTSTAGPLAGGLYQALAPAEETSTALLFGRASTRALPTAAETSEASTLAAGSVTALDRARETGTARPVTGRKTQPLPAAGGVDAAQSVTGRKALALGTAAEATSSQALAGAKRRPLGPAVENSQAQQLLIPGRVDTAEEETAARPLRPGKTRASGPALETVAARPVTGRKRATLTAAAETSAVRPLAGRKTRALQTAVAVDEAGQLGSITRLHLGIATETTRALIGPAIRLTWAAERGEARPMTGRRQRPADHLDATTSGPVLTTSTSGPALTTSTSGPHLAATSTGGG